jgi:hypothetical protein
MIRLVPPKVTQLKQADHPRIPVRASGNALVTGDETSGVAEDEAHGADRRAGQRRPRRPAALQGAVGHLPRPLSPILLAPLMPLARVDGWGGFAGLNTNFGGFVV